jgi:cytoskeletal protein CcmA (bactofilin family)
LCCSSYRQLHSSQATKTTLGKDLLISFNENFTGQTTIDGISVISGAFSDKGPQHQDNTVVGQSPDGTEVFVTGTVSINGANGTFKSQYKGTIHVNATNIAYIEGVESITGGTGGMPVPRERALSRPQLISTLATSSAWRN